jgi:L-serine dehydratase
MESLTELYKTGRGPSSSHTMGPEKACRLFAEKNPDADRFHAVLYGSLSKTGRGHGTDRVIGKTFGSVPCTVEFSDSDMPLAHPNTMDLIAYRGDAELDRARVMSVGGGKIVFEGSDLAEVPRPYALDSFEAISAFCR